MQINDRLLTLATGAVLAVGGAAVSLFLGEDSHTPNAAPETVFVASLSAPSIPKASTIVTSDASSAVVVARPAVPEVAKSDDVEINGLEREIVLAAVEPNQQENAGPDLAKIAVLQGAPALAQPEEFGEIVLTRTPTFVKDTDYSKMSARLPEFTLKSADIVKRTTTADVSCALDVRATPLFGARVALKVTAPCHPNVEATIEHGGLRFKEKLDADGKLELKVPVFAEYSRFDIKLADGTMSTVGAYIAGLSKIERVGIAWSGTNDTFLHALHNGAKIGDAGHVWRMNARGFAQARMNGGGYLTTLGDPTLANAALAQIFTLPMTASKHGQVVDLQIETLRGESACGSDLTLNVAQHRAKSGVTNGMISLTLPACGAVQDSLVLKNVLKGMKVARK